MKSVKTAIVWTLSAVLLVSVLAACGRTEKAIVYEKDVLLTQNLVFAKANDKELKLDIARPKDGKGPFPAVIYLFGSGWGHWSGGRFGCFSATVQAAHRGYVAVAVDYRQTSERIDGKPKYQFPLQVHDVKASVRWLRANAKRYRIDVNHIAAVGFSSGGHLALMLALTKPTDGLEGNLGNPAFASNVQAVVNCAGPTDLSQDVPNPESRKAISEFIGEPFGSGSKRYIQASPINYVTDNAPPILTIHGTEDDEVPFSQAELLDSRMKQMGAKHVLVAKQNLGHIDFSKEPEVLDFLDKWLKE